MPHFLDIDPVGADVLRAILEAAKTRKAARAGWPAGRADADAPLTDRVLALLFERPSTRTRVSFDMAIRQLGGSSLVLNAMETHLGRSEAISDTAQVLSRYVDAVAFRARAHSRLQDFATHSGIPVINGLTDRTHPCQILADIMTFEEHRGPVAGRKFAWCGDGNNVAHSLLAAAAKFDFRLALACPPGHEPDADILAGAQAAGGDITLLEDPVEAVCDADCVLTDAWVSMEDEGKEVREHRRARFLPYQVHAGLMSNAREGAIFLHCLPAYRGEEVTDEVLDSENSPVFDEAENRLHVQKAILLWCFGGTGAV